MHLKEATSINVFSGLETLSGVCLEFVSAEPPSPKGSENNLMLIKSK